MQIQNIKIEKLKPAEYNPRVMDDKELEKLKRSLKEFGVVEPIVINKDFTVIGGHQRLKALWDLKRKEVPCIILNIDKKKEKILNLALNRISGDWDQEKLSKLIKGISNYENIKLSGLDTEELEALSVQHDLMFGDDDKEMVFDSEEEVKKMFELNTRVPIDVERPKAKKQSNKVAFYTENFKQYKEIKKFFSAKNKSELDTNKLLKLIK